MGGTWGVSLFKCKNTNNIVFTLHERHINALKIVMLPIFAYFSATTKLYDGG